MGNSASESTTRTSRPSLAAGSEVDVLVQMGFPANQATLALQATANNIEAAIEILTEQRAAEERLKRASAAERRHADTRPGVRNNATPLISQQQPIAAFSQSQSVSRPSSAVKVDVRAQLVATATKLSDRPETVDTLLYVIKTIVDNPHEPKYRSIKTTNARFLQTLGVDTRTRDMVENFMRVLSFERAGEWLSLPPTYNLEALKEAVKVLQEIQLGEVYQASKRNLEFEKAIEMSRASANEEEKARRAVFAAKSPAVPPEGAAGTTRVTFVVSEGAPPLTRRFASDDVLLDVVHWIGSERSVICNKILEGAWILVDETLLQKKPLDVVGQDGHKSLYALGLWPSATLHVRLRT